MIACYHTHTKRCKHAFGEDEEYVLSAIARGVEVIGFSDHAPMPYPDGYSCTYKMEQDEIGEYFDSLLYLRDKYSGKIDIKIGFETEYYPTLWEKSLDFWSKYPLDYLILGQHFVSGDHLKDGAYSGSATNNCERLKAYTDRLITAINTGKISYIAHPDLLNFVGEEDFHRSEIKRLIKEANRLSIPVEINLLGLSEGRTYPKKIFWEEAGRLGATAIIGCDAHIPERVAKPDELLSAQRFADKYGVGLVDKIELKPVF